MKLIRKQHKGCEQKKESLFRTIFFGSPQRVRSFCIKALRAEMFRPGSKRSDRLGKRLFANLKPGSRTGFR